MNMDGGPAFPVFESISGKSEYDCREDGMSIRDYSANQALIGLLMAIKAGGIIEVDGVILKTIGDYAEASYKLADAMLKARGKCSGS